MSDQTPSRLRRRWKWIVALVVVLPLAYRVGLSPIPCGRSLCLPLQACLQIEGPGTIPADQPYTRYESSRCVVIVPGEPRYRDAMQPSQSPVGVGPVAPPPENIDQLRSEASQRNVRAIEAALTRARGSMRELPAVRTPATSEWKPIEGVSGMVEGERLLRTTSRDGGSAALLFVGRPGVDYRLFASAPRRVAIVRLVPDVRERRVKVASCGDGRGGAPKGAPQLESSGIQIDVADVGSVELREQSYPYEMITEHCDDPQPMP